MLMNLNEVSELIESGKWLHLSGNEALLKKLPKGNWIGGSTEYFLDKSGGIITDDKLFVQTIPYSECKVCEYDETTISDITKDAYDNGFSIVILPFDTEVHIAYAKNAADFDGIFMKNIVGWVSGMNLAVPGQTPITVNGLTGGVSDKKAVALHVSLPQDKLAGIGIVNIFSPSEEHVIEFLDNAFSVQKCLIDGNEVLLSDYLEKNNIDTKLPIIGDYSGSGINVSFKQIENGTVSFYAPVFEGIKYRFAKPIDDYVAAFSEQLERVSEIPVFACNCILNFLYGQLDGKQIKSLFGPVTFGEVAYQLVNQTLVYLSVY